MTKSEETTLVTVEPVLKEQIVYLMKCRMNELGKFSLETLFDHVKQNINPSPRNIADECALKEIVAIVFKDNFAKCANLHVVPSMGTSKYSAGEIIGASTTDVNILLASVLENGFMDADLSSPSFNAAREFILSNKLIIPSTANDVSFGVVDNRRFYNINYGASIEKQWLSFSLIEKFKLGTSDVVEEKLHPSSVQVTYTVFGQVLTHGEVVKLRKTIDFLLKEGPVVTEGFKVLIVINGVELDRREIIQLEEMLRKQTSLS